ncbi:hypothetical protein FJTKL_07215 [Diaporthe vaccinii]|uniref:Uncharacterized protein n=1 Tax=Diaporthe vaccinii TaxID=105482 RepID=A0ABR4EU54_9PEZI
MSLNPQAPSPRQSPRWPPPPPAPQELTTGFPFLATRQPSHYPPSTHIPLPAVNPSKRRRPWHLLLLLVPSYGNPKLESYLDDNLSLIHGADTTNRPQSHPGLPSPSPIQSKPKPRKY